MWAQHSLGVFCVFFIQDVDGSGVGTLKNATIPVLTMFFPILIVRGGVGVRDVFSGFFSNWSYATS